MLNELQCSPAPLFFVIVCVALRCINGVRDEIAQRISQMCRLDISKSSWVRMLSCMRPAGKYVLLYSGQGKVLVDGDAAVNWQAPGRMGITLTPAAGFAVRIVETNTSDPVRNISIVPAAKEATFLTDVYTPGFLKLVNGELPMAAAAF